MQWHIPGLQYAIVCCLEKQARFQNILDTGNDQKVEVAKVGEGSGCDSLAESRQEGWGVRRARSARRRDVQTLTVGWRASAVRGEEAGRFREVAGVTIDVNFAAGRSAVGTSLLSQHLVPPT